MSDLKPIKERVELLQEYWNTYSDQTFYEQYSDETFLEDALYGIGVSISGDYRFAQGFDKFKELLREHLNGNAGVRK